MHGWRLDQAVLNVFPFTDRVSVIRLPGSVFLEVLEKSLALEYGLVQFSGIQREPYLDAAQRVTAYYRHLDQFLSQLWEHQTGPKILAVVSAYGFEAPEGWRRLRALITGRRTNLAHMPTRVFLG